METQIGTMITGDFEENTMIFKIDGKMTLTAGKYAIVPIEEYNKLVKNITCTHCYGTGKDHGDESGKTACPSCK